MSSTAGKRPLLRHSTGSGKFRKADIAFAPDGYLNSGGCKLSGLVTGRSTSRPPKAGSHAVELLRELSCSEVTRECNVRLESGGGIAAIITVEAQRIERRRPGEPALGQSDRGAGGGRDYQQISVLT